MGFHPWRDRVLTTDRMGIQIRPDDRANPVRFKVGAMSNLSVISEVLGRAYGYSAKEQAALEGQGMTIALAREAGTPAAEVAQAVAARLGWRVYDHELLEQVAQDLGKPVTQLEALDENPQNWLLDCLDGFLFGHVSGSQYVHRMVQVIRDLAARGQCVIVGRGAPHVLPASSTLRVRLVGPLEARIAAERRRTGLNRKDGTQRVEEWDRHHRQFIAKYFLHDETLAEGYDLVLNTSQWSVDRCADLIIDAMRARAAETRR